MRPIGLWASPERKRYQYQRSGSRPSTSTCTEWLNCGVAMLVPWRSTLRMPSSVAISQATSIGSGARPPPGSSGVGANRVHSTMPRGVGSPEATPTLNGSAENCGRRVADLAVRPNSGTLVRLAAYAKNSRRLTPCSCRIISGSLLRSSIASTYLHGDEGTRIRTSLNAGSEELKNPHRSRVRRVKPNSPGS